jgi:hypothetical protein
MLPESGRALTSVRRMHCNWLPAERRQRIQAGKEILIIDDFVE